MSPYARKRHVVKHVTRYQIVLDCIRKCLVEDGMNLSDRTGRKPLVLFFCVEPIYMPNSELLQFSMSEPWDDMLVDKFAILDVCTFSDFTLMHILNPVFNQLLHGLVSLCDQCSLALRIEHLVKGPSCFSLGVAVALPGFAIVQDDLRHPLFAFAIGALKDGAGAMSPSSATLVLFALFGLFLFPGLLFFVGHAVTSLDMCCDPQ